MRETQFRYRTPIAGLLAALLLLSACLGNTRPTPTDATRPRPEKNVAGMVQPGVGGNVGLNSGAEVAVPPDALTAGTLVNLRALDDAPSVPVPLSLVGRAYEMVLEGGELSGTAILSLPYPAEINPADYQLDVYRWTGRTWEETGGRESEGMVRAGITGPGTFAVLGRWRMADAEVRASMPRVEPGRQTAQVLLAGEYRYEAPPRLVGDYIEGRLELKLDTSGGAGYSTGNPDLDQTISQNTLYFKPDAATATGLVNFSYTFEVSPGDLNIALGNTGSLYSALTVSDSAAPTRRLSSAVEYVQMVPIQVVGTDVVRPRLQAAVERLLRWHVQLNGELLFTRPGLEPALSLAEALARGGLGEYKIQIEAEQNGAYVPVSNEVTVRLASPSAATPTPQRMAGGSNLTPTPTSRVNPFGTMPPTPTRRVNTQNLPTDTPTPPAETPTPAPTATPTRPPEASVFWADSYGLRTGDCTTVHWSIQNVREVYYNERAATGREDRQECPAGTTNYVLRIVYESGQTELKRFTITVQGVTEGGGIEFWADHNEITAEPAPSSTGRPVGYPPSTFRTRAWTGTGSGRCARIRTPSTCSG